jgi:hypothetical protein
VLVTNCGVVDVAPAYRRTGTLGTGRLPVACCTPKPATPACSSSIQTRSPIVITLTKPKSLLLRSVPRQVFTVTSYCLPGSIESTKQLNTYWPSLFVVTVRTGPGDAPSSRSDTCTLASSGSPALRTPLPSASSNKTPAMLHVGTKPKSNVLTFSPKFGERTGARTSASWPGTGTPFESSAASAASGSVGCKPLGTLTWIT